MSHLVLFVCVSVLSGMLVAGLVLPVLGGLGVAAKRSADGFESLPAELKTPPLPERTRILAADGSLIATFFDENRVSVPLARVAPVMRRAVVAIEDSRFYQHGGVDLRGTVRAFVNNQSGSDVQGGSTLTQQYVKQVLLESAKNLDDPAARAAAQRAATEQSYSRKLRELRYAVALEGKLSKDQILEGYLNIAYFGAGAYGVEAAARHYFSISAKKLTLAQAALLAGIVQQPTAFNPVRNPDRALARRNVVLTRMAQVGYATAAEVAAAQAIPLALAVPRPAGNGCEKAKAAFFCNYVLNVVKNDPAFGATKTDRLRLLLRGGLTITTTLDRPTQAAAQAAVRSYVDKTDKVASAVVSVEPGTGAIKAMALSRDFGNGKGRTKLNYAVDKAYEGGAGFQAGSTFKPFVAAAALEQGYPFDYPIVSPYQKVIGDVKWCGGTLTDPWDPRNESRSENGTYTLRSGIANSVNTYFAQLEQRTGVCRPATIAKELGVTRADGQALQQVKSFTLGTNVVSPLSMAEAYATFAARGVHCNGIAITRVTDPAGAQLRVPAAGCEQVIDQRIADGVTSLLRGVMTEGTGARVALDRPSAGKTGTTDSRVHVWFVGYTPELSTAVWAGNPSPGKKVYRLSNRVIGGRFYGDVCGGCLPGPIWRQTMNKALENTPVSSFADAPVAVSQGTALRLPSLVGRPPADAQAALDASGLTGVVSAQPVQSATAPIGTVAYTQPAEGAQVFPGQSVTLYVSSGPPPVAAPVPAQPPAPDPASQPTTPAVPPAGG